MRSLVFEHSFLNAEGIKVRKLTVLFCSLLLILPGCGSGTSTQTKAYVNTDGYPLDICPVSGRKLGDMGEPYIIKYSGKTVKLCCSACLKEFNTDPAKYMAILNEAEAKKNAPAK